jgi:hypothetical protein
MTLKTVNRLQRLQKDLSPRTLTDQAFPVFVEHTPERSGNARRHTFKSGNEIQALYPYAERLDHGYSHQSPDGMVKPTVAAVRAYITKTLGK